MKYDFPERSSMGEGNFERPQIDSKLNQEKELEKIILENPESREIMERQEFVTVKYLNKDNKFCEGQICVDKDLVNDIQELFAYLLEIQFRIEKVIPIQDEKFNSSDDLSMQDNNSSGLNYRYISGTKRLSLHAFGFAIDINPRENPVEYPDGTISPAGTVRDLANPDVFTAHHPVVQWLEAKGWEWGGHWVEPYHDNHHFQKPLATEAYKENLRYSLEAGHISQEDYEAKLARAEQNSNRLKNEKI